MCGGIVAPKQRMEPLVVVSGESGSFNPAATAVPPSITAKPTLKTSGRPVPILPVDDCIADFPCLCRFKGKRCFQATALRAGAAIGPGQQLVDPAVGMAVDDLGDDVGEIGLRIDAAEFAGLDQRGDDGPVLAAAVGAGEQRVLAVERDRSDAALDDVGVDLDAAVVEEAVSPSQRERA